ncbi:MAG: tRNA pseudouridine(13) synthase TruD [bacterium]
MTNIDFEGRGDQVESLPELTDRLNGIQGTFQKTTETFQVEEIPAYEPNGSGPHLYFEVTKENLTTSGAIEEIANWMNVSPREIGRAGRKDKHARTTQRMSLEHADEDRIDAFEHDRMELKILDWHRNKLKPGHLRGNHFRVRIRDVQPGAESNVETILRTLRERGVPAYYGPQRFGDRNKNAELGQAMLDNKLDEFVELFLGQPVEQDPEPCYRARELFDEGQYEQAIDAWPARNDVERRALATYIDTGSAKPVLSSIPKGLRQLFINSVQSQLFNHQVADRVRKLDQVWVGDIAKKTDTGGMFEVEKKQEEQARCDRWEISPTGLLTGPDNWHASGKQGNLEKTLLDQFNLPEEAFEKVSYLNVSSLRRPLRLPLGDVDYRVETNKNCTDFIVEWTLPSGGYATVVLKEIMDS